MKIRLFCAFALLLSSVSLLAQGRPSTSVTTSTGAGPGMNVMYHRELGKWWKNSETAKKLQLTDNQIGQLDQTFYDHKVKLIDYGADMEKQDLKLQTLLDADVPDEAQVVGQVDQVLTARGKLEREYTLMNLDLRKVLSLEQWRQLKSIRGENGGFGEKVFFRKVLPAGMEPLTVPPPPGAPPLPPPPPPPGPDELD